METLAENIEGQVEVPKNLVIMKEIIEENGGNPKQTNGRSLKKDLT